MPVLKRKGATTSTSDSEPALQPQPLETQIAEMRSTIARLQKLEREASDAAAAAFRAGGQPEPERRVIIRRTAELLLQGIDVLARPEPATNRMLILDERVAAIREALRIATSRLQRLFDLRTDEIAEEFAPIWRNHLHRVMSHVNALFDLAAERRELLDRLARDSGVKLSPDGADEADELLGLLDSLNPNHVVADSAVARLTEAAKRAGLK